MARVPAADRRQAILAAAVRVFARQGFHGARVSDVAEEAGVAHGLVFHYFGTKSALLDTVFSDRWDVLLAHIRATDARELPAREKLEAIASFIIDSYRHDPDVMKVVIVEVTRAANTFGRTHLPRIGEAFDLIAEIVADAQASGELRDDLPPRYAAMAFYGAIEQVLTGWIFALLPTGADEFEQARVAVVETIFGGLQPTGDGRSDRTPGLAWATTTSSSGSPGRAS